MIAKPWLAASVAAAGLCWFLAVPAEAAAPVMTDIEHVTGTVELRSIDEP